MVAPALGDVQAYYDERVDGKLRDFTHPNPRIEAAIHLIAEWAPTQPRRILEIGCGIGATPWRMARAWPQAEVIGADVSADSIEVAKTCFQRPNLTYRAGLIKDGVLEGKFDLIVMMDVYEHIAVADRPGLHAALKSLLSVESRLIVTVPTPALQAAAANIPDGLQPVDEDIGIEEIKTLSQNAAADLLYYRKLGIWEYGDYAHIVFGRFQELAPVAVRQNQPPEGLAALKQRVKRLVRGTEPSTGLKDYLGTDSGRPRSRDVAERFAVSLAERRRLASAWADRKKAGR
ncbi:MAG: class I SAM-dependent methyltransferase [Deltaproteobacteria bacterium]|nr:class I SAM-dependent methyltransferase [Deltaproteobacteria bacterium]